MALPKRTFSASVGQASTGAAGPDYIEADLDAIFSLVDKTDVGLGEDSLQDDAATDDIIGDRVMDDTFATPVGTGPLTSLLSSVATVIKGITGGATWLTAPVATITAIWDKFHETTGHGHTGVAGDGTQIGTDGIADGAVTADKIADSVITSTKVDSTIVSKDNFNSKIVHYNPLSAISWGPGVMTSGKIMSLGLTATGAVVGDFVICSLKTDVVGLISFAKVTAADVVTTYVCNISDSTLASGSAQPDIVVIKKSGL